jgi:hypothetical protein
MGVPPGCVLQVMAETGQRGRHSPQPSQRSMAMAGFSRLQSTSMIMQYFMHLAQQTSSGSKMASRGQTEMHSRQSVHLSASMTGSEAAQRPLMTENGGVQ